MNTRDEINKIIAANCYAEEDKTEDNVIMGDDFGKLADDLVKFCNMHFVRVAKRKVCFNAKCDYCDLNDTCLIPSTKYDRCSEKQTAR